MGPRCQGLLDFKTGKLVFLWCYRIAGSVVQGVKQTTSK